MAMTVLEALDLSQNVLTLNESTAKGVLRALTRETQKRYDSLRGYKSPAWRRVRQQFGNNRPTMKRGLTLNQMRHYIGVNQDFLMSRTGTVEGYMDWQSGISATLGNLGDGLSYDQLTPSQQKKFWNLYNSIVANGNESALVDWSVLDSNQKAQQIMRIMKSNRRMTVEEQQTQLLNNMSEMANNIRRGLTDFN